MYLLKNQKDSSSWPRTDLKQSISYQGDGCGLYKNAKKVNGLHKSLPHIQSDAIWTDMSVQKWWPISDKLSFQGLRFLQIPLQAQLFHTYLILNKDE